MVAKIPKKLIVCCDGTGNEIKEKQSNVLKFYHMLEHNDTQLCFYDPGIGTISSSGALDELFVKSKSVFALMTGFGLDRNVLDAYRFIVKNYLPGDEIYLFGFSRGAYTVRVLAAFIHMVGVLQVHQEHLCSYAFRAYKNVGIKGDHKITHRVNKTLRTHRPVISMLGCWDTVGSVIIPTARNYYFPTIELLPFVQENPSVKKFRHAMAIDEKRRMFRLVPWKDVQPFNKVVYRQQDPVVYQDVEQVWFAGVHCDVGGGYAEQESGLAKIPLIWMMESAQESGLKFRKRMVKMMAYGQDNYSGHQERAYVGPNPLAQSHDSMTLRWKWLEYLPRRIKHSLNQSTKAFLGWYIQYAESRTLGVEARIHGSVFERLENGDYQPDNISSNVAEATANKSVLNRP